MQANWRNFLSIFEIHSNVEVTACSPEGNLLRKLKNPFTFAAWGGLAF